MTKYVQTVKHVGAQVIKTERSYWNQVPTKTAYYNSTSTASGFSKPAEPVVNPKEPDGYRQPSNYQTQLSGNPSVKVELGGVYTYSSAQTGYRETNIQEGDAAGSIVGLNASELNANHVRTKVLNNARDEILDASMVLAELSGTVSTLTDNLGRVGRSMMALRRGRPKEFYYLLTGRLRDGRRPTDKFLRETASAYLEWKYGIMPTIYDIRGACEGLDLNANGKLFDNPPLLVARASHVETSDVNGVICRFRHYGGSQPQIPVIAQVERQLHARLDYTVTAEGLRGLNRYGVGLSSVATVGWELVPFSFVIDMALPIGQIIKAWSALEGCTVRSYCETQYRRYTVQAPETKYAGGAYLNGEGTATLPRQVVGPSFTRRAFRHPPMPVPYLKNPVKTGNLATVLALFTTLRRPDAK